MNELALLVGLALTGEELQLGPGASAQSVVAGLTAAGWDAERIARLRGERLAAGEQWPRPITAEKRGGVGAAQLHTATQAVIAALGIDAVPRTRDRSVQPDARDRALLADRPPHHG